MNGSVDPKRRPILPVWVEGPFGSEQVNALVDTGFNGFVSLPQSVIYRLGMKRYGRIPVLSANGVLTLEVAFEGATRWTGGLRSGLVIESAAGLASIGTELMDGSVIEIDFGRARTVSIK